MAKNVVKTKEKFVPSGFTYRLKQFANAWYVLRGGIPFLIHAVLSKKLLPYLEHDVPADFMGVNVAPSSDNDKANYMYERLQELNVKCVRIDFGYDSFKNKHEEFVDGLIERGFDVLIHLVQPANDASRMNKRTKTQQWREFITKVFKRFHGKVEYIEVGTTPNRNTWSGYTILDYRKAFKIACEVREIGKYNFKFVAPNVSDFAPYFTIGAMQSLLSKKLKPEVMSDNLFVDRTGQPENYDWRAVTHKFKDVCKLNLVNKSKILKKIAIYYKTNTFFQTYAYWTMQPDEKPNKMRYVDENQYVCYQIRYFTLCAAAGYFNRVYWGSICSHYKGIINDGYPFRPYPPFVHHKYDNYGELKNYRIRPGFYSLKNLIKYLPNSKFIKRHETQENVYIFEFEKDQKKFFIAWTIDFEKESLSSIKGFYNTEDYQVLDAMGDELSGEIDITEKPIFLIKKIN